MNTVNIDLTLLSPATIKAIVIDLENHRRELRPLERGPIAEQMEELERLYKELTGSVFVP